MIYWPGTNIVKSRGNAFDWRGEKSELVKRKVLAPRTVVVNAKPNITFKKEKR